MEEPPAKRQRGDGVDDAVVGFIGAGQMAMAIIRGIIDAKIRFRVHPPLCLGSS